MLIRAGLGACRMSQAELARHAEISKSLLNFYLNERCLLFESDLRRVLRAVSMERAFDRELNGGVFSSTV